MYDLIDLLEDKLTPAEIVELLNEVFHDFKESKEELKEYAIGNNICPMCTTQLSVYSWKEDRGEHFGFPAFEEMTELRCPECGWKKEE